MGRFLNSFTLSRGLREGDLLSPFLFLLVVDALSALVNKFMREEGLVRVRICRRVPMISHLLFAEDSLLFCANQQQAIVVKGLLNTYASSMGHSSSPPNVPSFSLTIVYLTWRMK